MMQVRLREREKRMRGGGRRSKRKQPLSLAEIESFPWIHHTMDRGIRAKNHKVSIFLVHLRYTSHAYESVSTEHSRLKEIISHILNIRHTNTDSVLFALSIVLQLNLSILRGVLYEQNWRMQKCITNATMMTFSIVCNCKFDLCSV